MNRRLLALTAASVFAASGMLVSAHAETVKCAGINACKGQSSCQSAKNGGNGQNACKGQGWSESSSASECTGKGGKAM